MGMILKIAKVIWFMFVKVVVFIWLYATKNKNTDALLEKAYIAWSDYILDTFKVDLNISGRENIPATTNRKIVILSNHQSQLDIPALVYSMNRSIGFVAKRELGRIPLLNYFMPKVGCVYIDRSDGRGANLVLEKAAKEMGNNPLVVFPEGTRSKDGAFLPLKQGGCRMAIMAEALILPVRILGTRNAAENFKDYKNHNSNFHPKLNPKINFASKPGSGKIPVSLTFFPVLDTRDLGDGKLGFNTIKDYLEKCWNSPSELN